MAQVCSQCSRINPTEAAYCYFDGVRLAGAGTGGPVNAATANFPIQFVFPSGQTCRNFDQLALACQQNWQAAVDLLKTGLLSNFFGGLGRADLALAAQEAARFPDTDRGLDQLLAKLPAQALQAPKLKVEPSEVNLGEMKIGTDRTFELHLANQGMRLIYGTIASDSKWLTFGEGALATQKLFQFGADTTITVHVRGQYLRAGTKPLEGQFLIESNAGNFTVSVKATVPITPLKEGVLAGSLTPRQVAEKAKANPAAAAPHFENGSVAKWFQSNGWIYPVQGPSAQGIGAVQQFFEALGLAKAPKVEINTSALTLKGGPGQALQATIEVSTPEKKPVYAHATCDQVWVDVSKVKLAGRLATITVAIPSVPSRPGEALKANIHVQGNGNQRFTVPLTLNVSGTAPPPNMAIEEPEPFAGFGAPAGGGGSPFEGFYAGNAPIAASPPPPTSSAVTTPRSVAPSKSADRSAGDDSAPSIRKPRQHLPFWVHLTPLVVLFLILIGLLVRDLLGSAPPTLVSEVEEEVSNERKLTLLYDFPDVKGLKDENPREVFVHKNFTFGLFKIEPSGEAIRLFFAPRGSSNNTLIHFNKAESTFGKPGTGGEWAVKPKFENGRVTGTWKINDVYFTQTVSLEPGEPHEDNKRYRDNCVVRYKIENKDSRAHSLGLRVMLDTFIGMNDGVPFTIPGMKGLMSTSKEFKTTAEVPDFIMALENASLDDPRTVVQLNLHLGGKIEPPSRVLLTRWPGAAGGGKFDPKKLETWEVPLLNIGDDSSVVMYWNPKKLEAGESREIGYSYGLGSLSNKGGQLALTVGGSFVTGSELSVVALVNNPKDGDKATLTFGKEFTLVSGTEATQPVPPPQKDSEGKLRPVPITWRIRSTSDGTFNLRVDTTSGAGQQKRVVIRKTSLF